MEQKQIEQIAQAQIKNQEWQRFMEHISDSAVKAGNVAHLTIELTALCTLKCKMCYVRLDKEKADGIGRMRTAKEWIMMAEQFRDAGGLTVLITGGEAMMRPDFCQIYEAISRMGLFVTVFTNGTTISDDILELFAKRPPSLIGLTLYGASEETYELVTGVRGFQRAIEGLDRLLSLPKINIDVRFTACSLNYKDYEKLQRIVGERGLVLSYDVGDMAAVRGASSMASKIRLSEEEQEELKKHLRRSSAPILDAIHKKIQGEEGITSIAREGSEVNSIEKSRSTPTEFSREESKALTMEERHLHCRAATFGVYIAFDGRMYPCDTFSEPYCTEPFRDGFVAAYKQLQKIAQEILVPENCARCENIMKCGPCAARLIAEQEACKREGRPCGFRSRE